MIKLLLFTTLFLASVAAASKAEAGILYGADGSGGNPSKLYTIDTTTGVGTEIGSIGFAVTGLAFDPTSGLLYGVTASKNTNDPPKVDPIRGLLSINLATGAGTYIGDYSTPSTIVGGVMSDISFDRAGNLFGWNEQVGFRGVGIDNLYSINKLTGDAMLVGTSGVNTMTTGLAFDSNGTLFLESLGNLYTVNPVTGAATFVGGSLASTGLGMDFDESDSLFAIQKQLSDATLRNLITIDTSNGTFSVIGTTVPHLDALAFQRGPAITTPEPTSVVIWGLGMLGCAIASYRRRRSACSAM